MLSQGQKKCPSSVGTFRYFMLRCVVRRKRCKRAPTGEERAASAHYKGVLIKIHFQRTNLVIPSRPIFDTEEIIEISLTHIWYNQVHFIPSK